jgi:hypothetical protein
MENAEKVIDDSQDSAESSINKDDIIKEFIESKDFADLLNKQKGEAVRKFQAEKMPTLIEEEFKKRSEKTPEQIKFEEYERKLTDMQRKLEEKEKAELRTVNKTKALKAFSDKGLPTDMVDFLVDIDEEKTNKNIELAVGVFESYAQSLRKTEVKNNNTFVPGKNETPVASGLQVPGDDASQAEWEDYYRKKKKLK